jgi:ribosomal protein S15P/S13E
MAEGKGRMTEETQNDTLLCCLQSLILVNEFHNLLNHVKVRDAPKLIVLTQTKGRRRKVLLYLDGERRAAGGLLNFKTKL